MIVTATEAIWHEYHQRLAAFIRSKVAEEAVDDVLQDVFVKVHARIDSLQDDTKLQSWLYQLTRNTIIDHYRAKRSTEALPDWLEQAQTDEVEAIRQALSSCLEPMIAALPEKYAAAVRLSELDNMPLKAVAAQAGLSLSGAKSRVQRGRALLKGLLQDCCRLEISKDNQIVGFEKRGKDCGYC